MNAQHMVIYAALTTSVSVSSCVFCICAHFSDMC